jgi:uncharacterized protein YgfB (UPF0149 family)
MYADVLELLPGESGVELPAELHGLVCGAITAGFVLDEGRWHELTQLAGVELGAEDSPAVLLALLRGSQSMDADDFGFEPLLPDDDVPLTERLQALSAWCDGYLLAFGVANPDSSLLSEDASGALEDLVEVAQVDSDVSRGDEEAEWQYAEVREFVKAAALLIREELRESED